MTLGSSFFFSSITRRMSTPPVSLERLVRSMMSRIPVIRSSFTASAILLMIEARESPPLRVWYGISVKTIRVGPLSDSSMW